MGRNYDYDEWLQRNNYPDTVNNQRYFSVYECGCDDPREELGKIYEPQKKRNMSNGRYNNNNNGNRNYGNNNRYNNNNNRNSGQQKKHSGCQTKKGKNDSGEYQVTYGCMFRKRVGLVNYFAKTYKGTKATKSETGRTWLNVVVEVTNKQAGTSNLYTGMMDAATGRVTIKQLGIVMSPKGGRGGYIGPYGQRS